MGFFNKIQSRNIKLSYFKQKGLFRKYVGGRMFYLGSDKFKAQRIAGVILALRSFRQANGEGWLEEDLEFIRQAKEQVYHGPGRVVLKWNDQNFEYVRGAPVQGLFGSGFGAD